MRVPAAMCGVVGLRPTVGRSAHSHCAPTAFSIAAWGPLAASTADAAIVYSVMANAGVQLPGLDVPWLCSGCCGWGPALRKLKPAAMLAELL